MWRDSCSSESIHSTFPSVVVGGVLLCQVDPIWRWFARPTSPKIQVSRMVVLHQVESGSRRPKLTSGNGDVWERSMTYLPFDHPFVPIKVVVYPVILVCLPPSLFFLGVFGGSICVYTIYCITHVYTSLKKMLNISSGMFQMI